MAGSEDGRSGAAPPTAAPPSADDLRALEADKLREEIARLRQERGFWTRKAPVVLSLAAGIFSVSQGMLAITGGASERRASAREQDRKCLETGLETAKFALDRVAEFGRTDAARQVSVINTVLATFPAEAALNILRAFEQSASIPAVTGILRDAQERLRSEIAQNARSGVVEGALTALNALLFSPDHGCIGERRPYAAIDHASTPPPGVPDRPTPRPEPAAPGPATPGPAIPGPASPAPTVAEALTVFYQVTRDRDRDLATALGQAVAQEGAGFPKAGVELIRGIRDLPATQVRYYFADQAERARSLAEALRGAAARAQVPLQAQVQFIGDRFPNLPRGRIEVWFQPLDPAPR
ncbi:hypothetical protein [Paracraurococcus ruber]|uniref:Uncharacterized protein n=1 Tax=Paracraurococcus ruber TaxID=77675 RepID=A0ABS1D0J6_9PROT|nr:hypothetical protein [Paracraurococcus ruber]MBK1660326.1 hypothetical protein [Paracraurococcus ruber]TDG30638.1 hypothetical protein E2C05_13710 [Paracraurococcus ruber]